MNHDLIDQQILNLLRVPAELRTQERIAEILAHIAEATQLTTSTLTAPLREETTLTMLQREHIKLAAIADFLKQELNFECCSTQHYISGSDHKDDRPLSVLLTNYKGETFMYGYGRTAEEALRDLRTSTRTSRAAA